MSHSSRDRNDGLFYQTNGSDIKLLAEILKEESDPSDEDDLPDAGMRKMGPGDINSKCQSKIKMKVKGNECSEEELERLKAKNYHDPKAIWQLDEVEQVACCDDILFDPREKPQYDITYRQNVSTEDVYLQLGNRTPMTASCEIMIITIQLPREIKENIDCNLSKTEIDIRTPIYRLHLPFPHPVEPDSSQATWDTKNETLTITLRLNREFDFANF